MSDEQRRFITFGTPETNQHLNPETGLSLYPGEEPISDADINTVGLALHDLVLAFSRFYKHLWWFFELAPKHADGHVILNNALLDPKSFIYHTCSAMSRRSAGSRDDLGIDAVLHVALACLDDLACVGLNILSGHERERMERYRQNDPEHEWLTLDFHAREVIKYAWEMHGLVRQVDALGHARMAPHNLYSELWSLAYAYMPEDQCRELRGAEARKAREAALAHLPALPPCPCYGCSNEYREFLSQVAGKG